MHKHERVNLHETWKFLILNCKHNCTLALFYLRSSVFFAAHIHSLKINRPVLNDHFFASIGFHYTENQRAINSNRWLCVFFGMLIHNGNRHIHLEWILDDDVHNAQCTYQNYFYTVMVLVLVCYCRCYFKSNLLCRKNHDKSLDLMVLFYNPLGLRIH